MNPKLIPINSVGQRCDKTSFATPLRRTNRRELEHRVRLPHLLMIFQRRIPLLRDIRHAPNSRRIQLAVEHISIPVRYFILHLHNTVNLTAINTYVAAIAARVLRLVLFLCLPVEGVAVVDLFEG